MAQHELQAAPLKVCAKLFSLPLRHLRAASAAGEIRTYCTGGRVSVALLSDIRAWLVTPRMIRATEVLPDGGHAVACKSGETMHAAREPHTGLRGRP